MARSGVSSRTFGSSSPPHTPPRSVLLFCPGEVQGQLFHSYTPGVGSSTCSRWQGRACFPLPLPSHGISGQGQLFCCLTYRSQLTCAPTKRVSCPGEMQGVLFLVLLQLRGRSSSSTLMTSGPALSSTIGGEGLGRDTTSCSHPLHPMADGGSR